MVCQNCGKEMIKVGTLTEKEVEELAYIERTLISERTKAGLMRAKAEGKQIGRRKGQIPRLKLDGKDTIIKRMRNQGMSKNKLSVYLGVSRVTLLRYMRDNDIK